MIRELVSKRARLAADEFLELNHRERTLVDAGAGQAPQAERDQRPILTGRRFAGGDRQPPSRAAQSSRLGARQPRSAALQGLNVSELAAELARCADRGAGLSLGDAGSVIGDQPHRRSVADRRADLTDTSLGLGFVTGHDDQTQSNPASCAHNKLIDRQTENMQCGPDIVSLRGCSMTRVAFSCPLIGRAPRRGASEPRRRPRKEVEDVAVGLRTMVVGITVILPSSPGVKYHARSAVKPTGRSRLT